MLIPGLSEFFRGFLRSRSTIYQDRDPNEEALLKVVFLKNDAYWDA